MIDMKATRLSLAIVTSLTILVGSADARQIPAPVPSPDRGPITSELPGSATLNSPILPAEVQIVRFTAPNGTKIELLGPSPEPIVAADASTTGLTFGLKVGVAYRLKLSNLPNAPGAELFPMIELVGHLHRAPGVDPLKFPIRVPFTEDDLEDTAVRGRMVTSVVYL